MRNRRIIDAIKHGIDEHKKAPKRNLMSKTVVISFAKRKASKPSVRQTRSGGRPTKARRGRTRS